MHTLGYAGRFCPGPKVVLGPKASHALPAGPIKAKKPTTPSLTPAVYTH